MKWGLDKNFAQVASGQLLTCIAENSLSRLCNCRRARGPSTPRDLSQAKDHATLRMTEVDGTALGDAALGGAVLDGAAGAALDGPWWSGLSQRLRAGASRPHCIFLERLVQGLGPCGPFSLESSQNLIQQSLQLRQ